MDGMISRKMSLTELTSRRGRNYRDSYPSLKRSPAAAMTGDIDRLIHARHNHHYFVAIRRVRDFPRGYAWEIRRRRKPMGVKLEGGVYRSAQSAHAAGTEVLYELLRSILREGQIEIDP